MNSTGVSYLQAVEDHFRQARGTGSFFLSPLDWALVDAWRSGGIPLEAVFRGIDVTFEKWHKRPAQARIQMVNSIAYCAQPIAEEAQAMANASAGPKIKKEGAAPFPIDDVRAFLARNAELLRKAGHEKSAASLESLDLDALYSDLEQLEQRLTAIEEMMIASLCAAATEEQLLDARHALDHELKPYRNRMTADQIGMLEKKFMERRLLEAAGLPRLSLFYL
jgi:hypothetical protein